MKKMRLETKPIALFILFLVAGTVAVPHLLQAQSFNPGGKRDPFLAPQNPRSETVREVAPPPLVRRPPGLPGLLISEVTVTGTASAGETGLVVLRGIDNATYLAREGSRLFDGYLDKISTDEVQFTREVRDTRGETRTQRVVKRILTEE